MCGLSFLRRWLITAVTLCSNNQINTVLPVRFLIYVTSPSRNGYATKSPHAHLSCCNSHWQSPGMSPRITRSQNGFDCGRGRTSHRQIAQRHFEDRNASHSYPDTAQTQSEEAGSFSKLFERGCGIGLECRDSNDPGYELAKAALGSHYDVSRFPVPQLPLPRRPSQTFPQRLLLLYLGFTSYAQRRWSGELEEVKSPALYH